MAEQEPKKQEEGGGKKKGKGKVVVIILLILIIIALGIIIFLLLRKKPEAPSADTRGYLINEENMEEIAAEMAKPIMEPQTYDVTMNSTWNFDSGDKASTNAYVENATSNHNDVYFDVTMADTGEMIMESPVIKVGQHMDNIKLDKKLGPGTYNCILTYYLLDDQQNTLSTVKLALTINVLG